ALGDDLVDVEAGLVDALDHVLDRGGGSGHDVGLDLEAVARHADRLLHALLAVDREGPGKHVDDLAVVGHAHGPGGVHHPLDVVQLDLPAGPGDGDHAAAVLGGQMRPGQGDDHRLG